MQSAAPILLFLLVMAGVYIVTLSHWGVIERRMARHEARHIQIMSDCAEISDARSPASTNDESEFQVIPGDHFDVSRN